MGLVMIEPKDGVRMLEDLLYANRTAQAAALPLVRARIPETAGPFYSALTAQRSHAPRARPAAATGGPGPNVLSSLASARNGDRAGLMVAFLTEQVVKVLDLGAAQVDPQRSLMELGMDSLMAMELRNRLQAALNVRVAVADLMNGPSIQTLSAEMLTTLARRLSAAPGVSADAWEEGSL